MPSNGSSMAPMVGSPIEWLKPPVASNATRSISG